MNAAAAKVNDAQRIKEYLEFGMKLSVTIKFGPKDEYSLQSNLIGMKENQFLLMDMSSKVVEDLITRKTNNVTVVVRGITDTELGDIIAFKSQIISVVSRPTWLMFIKIPYSFETKPIRANKRFKLNLPVSVSSGDDKFKATLRDLSASGCGIFIDQPVDLNKGMDVSIQPSLEHFPHTSPVCHIMSSRRYAGGTFLGIKFATEIELKDDLKYEILEHTILSR